MLMSVSRKKAGSSPLDGTVGALGMHLLPKLACLDEGGLPWPGGVMSAWTGDALDTAGGKVIR